MAVRHFLTPPVDESGRVSAKAAKCSIVRKLPDGSCIGFERAADAIGHPTAQLKTGTAA